jgi:phosphohistidine swiveling domain-containing protein
VTFVHAFPGVAEASAANVGGKAHSLIRMSRAKMPVPPGVVLTTAFFEPWFDAIRASSAWSAFLQSEREAWDTLCAKMKELCGDFDLTEAQHDALAIARDDLAKLGDEALFAVRSSSPEEDLESASFAGGYETLLGVRVAGLEDAIRRCFASSLDERVFVYKEQRGFDVYTPRIAVIVQQQIDSEVAGVGFSLNPLTNDYDEAVIDANWGQGESVVAGLTSPDHFVVNKVDREILEKNLGAKQVSMWLAPDGGTYERLDHRTAELTLSDAQLLELTDTLCRIESLYEKPMDIEWAYAGGKLHVLQARPITAYFPLAPEMRTRPNERRRLYMDGALSDGLTINAPISPMGESWMQDIVRAIMQAYIGVSDIETSPQLGFIFNAGCRPYLNLSEALWITSPKRLAMSASSLNTLMAETLANIDRKRYRTARRPAYLRFWLVRWLPKILWRMRSFLWISVKGILRPEPTYAVYKKRVEAWEAEMAHVDYTLPLDEFRARYTPSIMPMFFQVTLPALVSFWAGGLSAVDRVFKRAPEDLKTKAQKLQRGFTDNVAVEMGIELYRLAKRLDPSDFDDLERLKARIESRQMPLEFLEAWDAFMDNHGCRGPMEMDIANPRYGDDPMLALRQMSFMSVDDSGFDPERAHQHNVAERRKTYEELMRTSGWLRRRRLNRIHRIIELFAGTRDTPKYHMVMVNYATRKRVLIEGRRLAEEGRLDAPEHVFDLTFEDLDRANADSSVDLRKIRAERREFPDLLKAKVREFPQIVDSRGRILRPPPREGAPNEMSGMAVSPGRITGPVKVLHDPHEKPIAKGDVLVAYTTDPGWTPLFANAGAVLLEVGGILQHGAVVAREYGKPCVAGIDGLMTRLVDGQMVEVDGTTGIVRLL